MEEEQTQRSEYLFPSACLAASSYLSTAKQWVLAGPQGSAQNAPAWPLRPISGLSIPVPLQRWLQAALWLWVAENSVLKCHPAEPEQGLGAAGA